MPEQLSAPQFHAIGQTHPMPGLQDTSDVYDIDLHPNPHDGNYRGGQAQRPVAEQGAVTMGETTEAERIAAHVQDMQTQYGYYSYMEHGLGVVPEAEEPRTTAAPHIGHLSIQGTAAPIAETTAATPAWATKPLPSEGLRNKRYEKIFVPHPTLSDEADSNKIPWDERKYYPEMTPDSREASKQLLADIRMTDIDVDRILDRHGAPIEAHKRDEVIDRIRTDANLRYDLGLHFLDKIQALQRKMPDRVSEDTDKNPSFGRYPKELRELINSGNPLGSREYVSLLALSMLDGTYVERPDDPITHGADGRADQGVHRAAAELLLR